MNISGLAIGIAAFVMIMLFAKDELSYDKFHTKGERIYRLCEKLDAEEGQGENSSSQPFPVAHALLTDHPQLIEQTARFFNFQESSHTLQFDEIKFNEKRTYFADSTVFCVFDFPLEKGNPKKALCGVNSIVLTKDLARKYFGEKDPIGKMIKYDGKIELMVTGILADIPKQSHIHFDALVSFTTLKQFLGQNINGKNWVWNPCWTYLLLKKDVKPEELEKQFPSFIKKYFPDFIIPQATLYLQKLTEIHLNSNLAYELEANSDRSDLYILGAIGIFILVIACINFMNLSTARSAKRAKEVGIRKVLGSFRAQLIRQFLGESMLLSFIALIFAILLVLLFLPVFNSLMAKELTLPLFSDPKLMLVLISVTILVGIVAGIYPAMFLSAFESAKVLKGTFNLGRKSKLFRQGLVVLQFAISLSLIISTAFIYKQLKYLQSADLGFKKDLIVVLPVRGDMAKTYIPFSDDLTRSGRVTSVASMNDILGVSHNTHEYNYEGMAQNKKWIYFPSLIVSPTFIKTMGIKIIAGRDFNKDMIGEDSLAVVINEAMVKHLGWGKPENAIGKRFFTPSGNERVIGVAENYNFVSLKEAVGPFVLDISDRKNKLFWTKFIVVRIPPKDVKNTLSYIENKWNEFSNEYPFEFFFLDDTINKLYKSQDDLGKLVGYFSGLAIFIACLGLFALASFTTEQRTKEIGIRKVLGAPVRTIIHLMSKEFLKPVLISNLIAWPVTYFVMSNWLNNFAYRVELTFGVFVFAGLVGVTVALSTVLFHSVKAAYSNPVNSLKYE